MGDAPVLHQRLDPRRVFDGTGLDSNAAHVGVTGNQPQPRRHGIGVINQNVQLALEQTLYHPRSDAAVGAGDQYAHSCDSSTPLYTRTSNTAMKIKHISTAVMEANFDWTIVKVETDDHDTG